MRGLLLNLAMVAALAAPAMAADETAAMREAATGFYGVYQTMHVSGVPDDADRARFAPYISPRLAELLRQAAAAEDRFNKANKASPPLVEGDLFSSLFEGATAFTIGACGGATCAANLSHDDHTGKPVDWTDTVYLVKTPSGWRVDDVGYGGSWAFGNKGRLGETLKQVGGFP